MNTVDTAPHEPAFLAESLAIIDDIIDRRDALFGTQPEPMDLPGTELAQLLASMPESGVHPRVTLQTSLLAVAGSVEHLAHIVREDVPIAQVVSGALMRSALLGGARVVYILAPASPQERHDNLADVMKQEDYSLDTLYRAAENFTHAASLIPPAELVREQRARMKSNPTSERMGEAAMLRGMAAVVSKKMAESGQGQPIFLAEHLAWMFNIYSGIAHGYGRPNLVPGSDGQPGNFFVDLHRVAGLGQLAFHLAQEHSTPEN